ncbi:MAG: peptidoglycan-binding protein [Patescibacteria group bacterium]
MSITQSKVTGLLVFVAVLAIASFALVVLAPTAQAATFATNLKQGSTGSDVMELQKALNMNSATQVSTSGAGSPGNETSYFGSKTKAAVIKFQELYASEVLAPVGLTNGTGFVGPSTRAKLNTIGGVTTGSTVPGCTSTVGYSPTTGQKCDSGVTTIPTTGGALSVSGATQPANGLLVQSASRVPFTRITLTAGSNDVTVSGITVERGGAAVDSVFSGVVLLDENGTQLGIAKTFNSNHQATVGDSFTVKAGTSKTMTIAGNSAADNSLKAGQVVGINVIAVNTNGTVSGSLPISGALHTVNATLTIGSVTNSISSFDPNSTQSKPIGTTDFKMAGIRITAGSAEQVRLRSIRWNQTGSVGASDLANVKTYVDGTAYDAVASTDGKYFTSLFGSGIVIDKGLGKDIYVQGDIVGSSAAGRTVKFDIYKSTDVYMTGETYGYGITPPAGAGTAGNATSEFTAGTPWFDGSLQNVSAGTVSTISKASTVAAQNIAVNVPNQVLGGFEIDLKGEPISVQSQIFTIASTTPTGITTVASVLTSVSLYGPNGNIVAGPVDAVVSVSTDVGYGVSTQKVTFTDTVTYPIGKGIYTLKGKVPSNIGNGSTYIVSTVPSSQWTSVTGQTTGNTISLSTLSSSVAMNTMTVKAAALAITVSASPSAQNITAGTGKTFANYQLDASQSGEDVRFSSIPLSVTLGGTPVGTAAMVSACQLYDGSTALNTGSNIPTVVSGSNTFTLDTSLTVTKGTVKTLTLKCNLTGTAAGNTFAWGIAASPSITVTGMTSSNDVSETVTAATGPVMTIGTSALTVTKDSSSPAYAVVTGGSTGVLIGGLRFHATNEAINLTKVSLALTNTASSSPASLVQVTLWDGATLVGAATFTGANYNATSTLTGAFQVPKDGDKVMTVKVDLGNVGTGLATSSSGALVAVDYDGTDSTGTQGTGVDSGTTISQGSSSDTAMSGVRVMKSYPTVAKQTSGMSSTLIAQSGIDLYRFSITANTAGDVGLNKLVINLATSSASTANGTTSVKNVLVKAYTDSGFSNVVGGSYTAGQIVDTIASPVTSGDNAAPLSSPLTIPAGTTYYFKVVGNVAQEPGTTGAAGTVTTKISGDAAYPSLPGLMAAYVTGLGNFVWSPLSTTTAATANFDWTNGYQITGLPSGGTDSFTLTK